MESKALGQKGDSTWQGECQLCEVQTYDLGVPLQIHQLNTEWFVRLPVCVCVCMWTE